MDAFGRRWNEALAEGGGHFGAVVLEAERDCRRILAGAGLGPFEADSAEDYAKRIVRLSISQRPTSRGATRTARRYGC